MIPSIGALTGAEYERIPAALEDRMRQALGGVPGSSGEDARGLADAALDRLRQVLDSNGDRSAAFDLLAADALLTHACELAVVADPETWPEFVQGLLEEIAGLLSAPGLDSLAASTLRPASVDWDRGTAPAGAGSTSMGQER